MFFLLVPETILHACRRHYSLKIFRQLSIITRFRPYEAMSMCFTICAFDQTISAGRCAPCVRSATVDRRDLGFYSYNDAVSLIVEACRPLGPEYADRLKNGLTIDRWVDRYENLHKKSGAASGGCYDSPPYILMNYAGTLWDVYRLAHEAGHSMASELSRCLPYHYSAPMSWQSAGVLSRGSIYLP